MTGIIREEESMLRIKVYAVTCNYEQYPIYTLHGLFWSIQQLLIHKQCDVKLLCTHAQCDVHTLMMLLYKARYIVK